LIYQILNDKNKINKFKNNKKKLKSIALTFVTSDSGHKFKTNPIKVKRKRKKLRIKEKKTLTYEREKKNWTNPSKPPKLS